VRTSLKPQRHKDKSVLDFGIMKNLLKHEGHEGHEGKINYAFVLFVFFVFYKIEYIAILNEVK
jgi:hypothetical protein